MNATLLRENPAPTAVLTSMEDIIVSALTVFNYPTTEIHV